jgi:hypothetical protein
MNAVKNAVKDANLELLIELKKHLDHATRLHALFDRMLRMAESNVSAGGTDDSHESRACGVSDAR